MKGVSSVVATIILISITFVLLAATAIFISSSTTFTQNQIENDQRIAADREGKTIRIRQATNETVFLKNTGTTTINLSEIKIYVSNTEMPCTWNETVFSVGKTLNCTMPSYCVAGQILRVTAPGNFDLLSCESRAPNVVFRLDAVEDTFIRQPDAANYGILNYGSSMQLEAGRRSSNEKNRILLRFPEIIKPQNTSIIQASLYLYVASEDSPVDVSFSAYRVLQNWGEGNKNGQTATNDESSWFSFRLNCASCPNSGLWLTNGADLADDNAPENSTADRFSSQESSFTVTSINAWYSLSLTNMVKNWSSNAWNETHGLIIFADDESVQNTRKYFESTESTNKPYLEIIYMNTTI